jgi:hypothetical protein
VTGEPRELEENFRRMEDFLAPYGGVAPHLELLARFLGGQHFEGAVVQSTGVLAADDTTFTHNLGRVPTLVIVSADTDGSAGRVVGLPAGEQGPIGANVSKWTRTEIAVRATVAGAYQFIVL